MQIISENILNKHEKLNHEIDKDWVKKNDSNLSQYDIYHLKINKAFK